MSNDILAGINPALQAIIDAKIGKLKGVTKKKPGDAVDRRLRQFETWNRDYSTSFIIERAITFIIQKKHFVKPLEKGRSMTLELAGSANYLKMLEWQEIYNHWYIEN